MATSVAWQPQEQGFNEICLLLEQQISPSSTADKSQIWQQIQQYSQFPDFNNYLAFILARAEGKSVEIRQAAGLLLKNNLRTAYKSMAPPNQQYIKSELLPCLGAADTHIRSTVGTIVSVVVQLEGITGWPELFQALVTCLDGNDINNMEGAIDALSKICEDIPQVLDSDVPGLAERPINIFLPRLLQFFRSPHTSLRKLSLSSVNQYVMLMPSALFVSMDQYLLGLFVLANDPSAEVRKLVCAAFNLLIEVRPSFLEVDPVAAGVQYDREFIVCCLDLLSGLAEGLGSGIERLVAQSNLRDLLLQCCMDDASDVRQSAFALLGDLARICPVHLHARLSEFLDIAAKQLNTPKLKETVSVANNACWAIGELAVKVRQEISSIVMTVVSCLVPILKHSEELNKSLIENSAITLGRLAWVCPELVSPHMEHFMQPWCIALSMIRDDTEKEDAFRGLCAMVKANPSGALSSLVFMCREPLLVGMK